MTSYCAPILICAVAWIAGGASTFAQVSLEILPSRLVGVVGSGDQIGLLLRDGDQTQVLRPGDRSADGWTLQTLSASEASFIRDGQVRQIGLNPSGLVAMRSETRPTVVDVVGTDEDIIAKALAEKRWNGNAALGLSLAETRRRVALEGRARAIVEAKRPGRMISISDLIEALGADGEELKSLLNRASEAVYQASLATYQRLGPISYHVDIGEDRTAAAEKAGIPAGAPVTFKSVLDPDGRGATVTLQLPPENMRRLVP